MVDVSPVTERLEAPTNPQGLQAGFRIVSHYNYRLPQRYLRASSIQVIHSSFRVLQWCREIDFLQTWALRDQSHLALLRWQNSTELSSQVCHSLAE